MDAAHAVEKLDVVGKLDVVERLGVVDRPHGMDVVNIRLLVGFVVDANELKVWRMEVWELEWLLFQALPRYPSLHGANKKKIELSKKYENCAKLSQNERQTNDLPSYGGGIDGCATGR